jgi:hypothetical protein
LPGAGEGRHLRHPRRIGIGEPLPGGGGRRHGCVGPLPGGVRRRHVYDGSAIGGSARIGGYSAAGFVRLRMASEVSKQTMLQARMLTGLACAWHRLNPTDALTGWWQMVQRESPVPHAPPHARAHERQHADTHTSTRDTHTSTLDTHAHTRTNDPTVPQTNAPRDEPALGARRSHRETPCQ